MMLKKQSNDVVVVVVSSIPNLIEIEKKSQEQATAGGQEKCQSSGRCLVDSLSVHLSASMKFVLPTSEKLKFVASTTACIVLVGCLLIAVW